MDFANLFKKIAIFKDLPETTLQELSAALQTRKLRAGEVLFHLGDPGAEMIVVQEGQLAIYMPGERPEVGQAIRVFNAGDMFGEMALIDQMPRSTSARAESDATILTLDGASFDRLVRLQPLANDALMAALTERIRYTTNFIGEMRGWVQRMGEGKYQDVRPAGAYADTSLAGLAADFVRMAAQVREREETLQREVAQLRIQIDENKRRQEVSQITQSDYYRSLKDKLKALREADDED